MRVAARQAAGTLGTTLLLWAFASPALAAPPNDDFAAAQPITGETARVTGNTFDATAEPGEPVHAGRGSGHSVWWTWTAPSSHAVTLDTCDSDFDTVLAVYTGDSVGALTPVASNDDACSMASSVTFDAVAGQTYRIAVDSGYDETGNVLLALTPTLTVQAQTLHRRHRVDATRLIVDAATGGDVDPAVPKLRFARGSTIVPIDLELNNEAEFGSATHWQYTFAWSCGRAGAWRWDAGTVRGGVRVAQQGSFSVPRCVRKGWYVSKAKVVRDFRTDFGSESARALRCSPVGPRHGPLAATWRCWEVRPGLTCTGGFRFRYTRTYQGGDLIESRRHPSGGVTCRG